MLKIVEDSNCRYYNARENDTVLERSKLVAAPGDLAIIKNLLSNNDVTESCKRKRTWFVKNFCRFVQYTPKQCFTNFAQSAVNARRERDKNPKSSDVVETRKFLANSSNGYQFMDWSPYAVTNYLSDEKTQRVINNKLFGRLDYENDQL